MTSYKFIKNIALFSFLITLPLACKREPKNSTKKEYLRHVGDSKKDSLIDNTSFKICYEKHIYQYFNFSDGPQYIGEKPTITAIFKANYTLITDETQNGLIRIRFVVNCEGVAGRFRIIQADTNYNETKFNDKIVSQLLQITKNIKKWEIVYNEDVAIDYYTYLIFKIKDGHITEILP